MPTLNTPENCALADQLNRDFNALLNPQTRDKLIPADMSNVESIDESLADEIINLSRSQKLDI